VSFCVHYHAATTRGQYLALSKVDDLVAAERLDSNNGNNTKIGLNPLGRLPMMPAIRCQQQAEQEENRYD